MTSTALDTAVVRRWKRYAKYRSTSVAWLPELPCHWEPVRLKRVSSLRYGDALPADVREDGMVPVYGSNGKVGSHAVANVRGPALVIGRKGSYGKVSYVACDCFVIDTAYFVSSATTKADLRWLSYATSLLPLDESSQDGAIPGLNREFAYSQWIPQVPLREQRAISAFLDRETARIDALIGHKQRLIALLEEKRQAVISHAVTRGLDPDAPLKDSGVPWIGMMPKHWEVVPLKRRWSVIDCKHRTVTFLDDGYAVASIAEVQRLDIDLSNAKRTSEADYQDLIGGGRRPNVGDIIYSRNATVGEAAFVSTEQHFCMGQDVCLLTSHSQCQRFLLHQLRSPAVLQQLDSLLVGSTFKRINVENIRSYLVCCPPLDEQTKIASFCDGAVVRIAEAMSRIRDGIAHLHEYRTALISAAVTGQIDVRGEV